VCVERPENDSESASDGLMLVIGVARHKDMHDGQTSRLDKDITFLQILKQTVVCSR
jgi:hypothetical protein